MHLYRLSFVACLSVFLFSFQTAKVTGQTARQFANVSPTLEIEILDPGVNSSGNPAVPVSYTHLTLPTILRV